MKRIQPPPIRENLFSSPASLSQVWVKWFMSIFNRDQESGDADVMTAMTSEGVDSSPRILELERKALFDQAPKDDSPRIDELDRRSLFEQAPKDYAAILAEIQTLVALIPQSVRDYKADIDDLELKALMMPAPNPTWENRIKDLEAGFFKYRDSLPDDATFNLPAITNAAHGFVVVGSDEERADFTIDGSGNVNLITASANVVVNANTDAKFDIGTAVANPLTIKNRLGSSKAVLLTLWYH